MPRLSQQLPKYRRLSAKSPYACVTIGGVRHMLGRYGTKTSKREYDRLVAEWLVNGRRTPRAVCDVTVADVMVAYLKFAQRYYRKNGKPTREFGCTKEAC